MRRFTFLLLACLLSATAWADPYQGTITSSGSSTTNLTTATPFNIAARALIYIQCDAAAYVQTGPATAPPTVSATNGERVEQYALFPISLTDAQNPTASFEVVAVIPVTGTSLNCKVFLSSP